MPRFALSVDDLVEAFAAGVLFADDFFAADFFDVCEATGRADSPEASPASDSDAVSSTTTRKCRPTFSRGPRAIRLAAYEKFLAGEMVDYDLSDEAVAAAMAEVPVIAG
ncbi:MAG: hypothetical protein ACO38A_07810 [Ilumatobacteraceae bacterium]